MNKKILIKDAFQSLTNSAGRFIGIMLLMMVSAFAFIGLKMTGSDMQESANYFYQKTNLADINISANYGLDSQDKNILSRKYPHAQLEYGYLTDSQIRHSQTILRILNLPQKISKVELVSGKLPTKANQIALSYTLQNKYHLGQIINFKHNPILKNTEYKITAFVRASDYTDKANIGQSSLGNGQISGVAYLQKDAFLASNYQIVKVRFAFSKKLNPYSKQYQNYIDKQKRKIQPALKSAAKRKNSSLQNQIAKNQVKLNALKAAGVNIDSSQDKLNKQKQLLAQTGPFTYYVTDRNNDSGYETFRSNTEKIELITNIFPVFLFAVAALVSLTAMTRLIEEQRQNIGLLRALGYSKFDASLKFIIYSLLASLSGALIGSVGGFLWLPKIIFNSYTANLTLNNFKPMFSWKYLLLTLLIAILCTTGAAVIQLFLVLKQDSADLLLPKPPKKGSHIVLEKIKPFWSHLSFNYKVTIRNIFRYKTKMLMTILGVAGCTGLLVMGFGIRDSLIGIGHKQYENIIKYDVLALEKPQLSKQQEKKLKSVLDSKQVGNHLPIHFEQLHKKISDTNQDISLIVPQTSSQLNKYIALKDRSSQKELSLQNNEVVISEKLANLLKAKKGDKVILKQSNGKNVNLEISQVCEMYMGHYVLMNPVTYQSYFKTKLVFNAQLLISKKKNSASVNKLAAKLLATTAVSSVNLNTNNKKIIDSLIESMNKVMYLLILLACLLAIVVIFTLTTANVEERMREISTVKVLGFYNNEATLYIYRETIILSLVGIALGFLIGNWLHSFILDNLAPINTMFDPQMLWTNYLISGLIPLGITGILSFFVYRKIKDIDMLKALQAAD